MMEILPRLTKNSKMAKTEKVNPNIRLFNFTLRAFLDCPYGKCPGCYARALQKFYPSYFGLGQDNYIASTKPDFVPKMSALIGKYDKLTKAVGKKLWIRIHDAGDFYSEEYVDKWKNIALANPDVMFYAYTTSVEWVHKAMKDVGNFIMLPSWGISEESQKYIADNNLPYVFVVPDESSSLIGDAVVGTDDDLRNAMAMKSGRKIALIAHGNKKKYWNASQDFPHVVNG